MLKKINGFLTVLLAVSMFVLVGCNFNNIQGTIDGLYDDVLTVTIDTVCTQQGLSARYIAPNNWDKDNDVMNMDLYLSGVSRNGKTVTGTDPLVKGDDGKYRIDLTYDLWDLTLSAHTTFNGNDVEVLKGSTTVDLRNGSKTIKFRLTTDGLNGNGGINISGSYTDASDAAKKIVISLLDFNTGAKIKTSDDMAAVPEKTFSYANNEIPAGEYTLEIKFKNDADVVIGYWSDTIRVAPGKITEKTTIDCGALNTIPAAPANLKVTNIPDSDDNAGYYNVKLEWDDNSTNEDSFLIYVYKYETWGTKPAAPTVILGTKKGAELVTPTGEVIFLENSMRVSGNLLAGHTTVGLKLQTGKIYDFEISARNIIGESDKVARVATTDYAAPDTENVARTKITYYLNGGTLNLNGENYNGTYIEFKKYAGENLDLLTIAAPVTLINNGKAFTKWTDTFKGTNEVTTTTGAANCTVWAQYLTDNEIDFDVESFENKLDTSKVSVTVNDADVKNAEVAVTEDTVIKFKITPDLGDGVVCDEFMIRINGVPVTAKMATASWNWDNVQDYDSVTYSIEVLAKPSSSNRWHSDQFLITLTR